MTPVPAEQLLGLELDGGWTVVEYLPRRPNKTGGTFSRAYRVQNVDGRQGFLKAMDFSAALMYPDWVRVLQSMINAYLFERDLLDSCRANRMDRVAVAIEGGEAAVDPASPIGRVPYLIFERAEGDIRDHFAAHTDVENAWRLRCLHNVAVGLGQLHARGIAHQDIKPSNILVFAAERSKIGDLGCASIRGNAAPRDAFRIAGDTSYAPPELLYGQCANEWDERRLACDLYLLGSMVVFMFVGATANGLLFSHVDYTRQPGVWAGSFGDVVPYLQQAFALALQEFSATIDAESRDRLTSTVACLCQPDPLRRGHPRNHIGRRQRYDIERFIAEFDLLARRIERRASVRRA